MPRGSRARRIGATRTLPCALSALPLPRRALRQRMASRSVRLSLRNGSAGWRLWRNPIPSRRQSIPPGRGLSSRSSAPQSSWRTSARALNGAAPRPRDRRAGLCRGLIRESGTKAEPPSACVVYADESRWTCWRSTSPTLRNNARHRGQPWILGRYVSLEDALGPRVHTHEVCRDLYACQAVFQGLTWWTLSGSTSCRGRARVLASSPPRAA